MYYSILPNEHHLAAERFLQQLPQWVSTSPTCRYLKPASLFVEIAKFTLAAQPHAFIAAQFELSTKAASRRDNAIRQLLEEYEPALYQAVLNLEQNMPDEVNQQAQAFKAWLADLLNTQTMPCSYCTSPNTDRIGLRLNFRCRTCRRTFDPLKAYRLNQLSHCELWLPFVDLLLQGAPCKTINRELGINPATAAKWRRYFLWLINKKGFTLLANYCQIQRQRRYQQTWRDVQAGTTFLSPGGSHFKPKWH